MDISAYLQHFETSLASYTGDDPLEQWERFVHYLEQRLPEDGDTGMSLVFDKLVQRFLNVERYADDARFVNYCIRCASFYSDPLSLYGHVFSKGVGTRSAVLYVSWAHQLEQRGQNEQADALFQKALANRAEPGDTVLHEYRQFQTRTRGRTPGAVRTPLQNSGLLNQMSSHPGLQNKAPVEVLSKAPAVKTVITVSRSETSGSISSSQTTNAQTVSQYDREALQCEGSELCFEEVRAARYFRKLQEKAEGVQRQSVKTTPGRKTLKRQSLFANSHQQWAGIKDISQAPPHTTPSGDALGDPGDPRLRAQSSAAHQPAPALTLQHGHTNAASAEASPHLSVVKEGGDTSQRWLDLDQQLQELQELQEPVAAAAVTHEDTPSHLHVLQPPDVDDRLDASQSATANLSHLTPNTSLGYVQATPSRVLPSPTVNTREALGVIMDMFQAPTFLDEPFGNTTMMMHGAQTEECGAGTGNVSAANEPPSKPAFTIFQDVEKENSRAAAPSAPVRSNPVRALSDITASSKAEKPNDTPPELMPDESTMWGARYNSLHSLAACPNSTSDFAMLAQCVSTPCTSKDFFSSNMYQERELGCGAADAEGAAFGSRPAKKLSPIIEQSPSDEKLSESSVSRLLPSSAGQGTIVGEALLSSSSSVTVLQPPPPAALSFRDLTLCSTESSRRGWEVYTSPEPLKPAAVSSLRPRSECFQILEDSDEPSGPERRPGPERDVPMSPECPLKFNWMTIRSPEAPTCSDMDAFMSPRVLKVPQPTSVRSLDVPMSPEQQPQAQPLEASMMSPDGRRYDATMDSAEPGSLHLVEDPWDEELISDLLSSLSPPLTSHPCCVSWQCRTPSIGPKMTLSMGERSLRVDCVVGEGAFATVYQVTDPVTSERMVLKVQRPANPWEFYIHTQLDARLPPDVRRLFSTVRSAHLFRDGSVLLGELHNYGTLLNAVNIYKTLSDKVMPQPLVLYFTVCLLHMVERIHAAGIIHADIKPDNFLLGERFLENKCFDPENPDHGLVLIDLGQSIDMHLFPQCTAFTARCLTSGFQCTEMLSGKPWSYQTDYFGIAGTVHCMLFGTYMQVTSDGGAWRTNGVFRRNPHSDLWQQFFHLLLNVRDCSSLPDLRELRLQLTAVLQQNYSSKLPTLKSRLVVLLLENRRTVRR